jgi:hypothetical protein
MNARARLVQYLQIAFIGNAFFKWEVDRAAITIPFAAFLCRTHEVRILEIGVAM